MVSKEGTESGSKLNIAALTIKTLFYTVLISAILFTSLVNINAYFGMKLYAGMEMDVRTLECAEKYLNRNNKKPFTGNDKVTDALICAVNTSVKLMNKEVFSLKQSVKPIKFAPHVKEHTTKFLENANIVQERIRIIDDYNKKNSIAEMHPNLYSYQDYVYSMNIRSKILSGHSSLVLNGLKAEADLICEENLALPQNMQAFAHLLIGVNQYVLDSGNYSLWIDRDGLLSADFNCLTDGLEQFIAVLLTQQTQESAAKQLQIAYYSKLLNENYELLKDFAQQIEKDLLQFKEENHAALIMAQKQIEKMGIVEGAAIKEGDVWAIKTVSVSKWYVSGIRLKYVELYYA